MFKRFDVILVVVLVLAAYLRFSGAKPGYPPYHSDDGISYSAAASMIKNGNLDPLRYDYPTVTPLTNYFFYKYLFIPIKWSEYYLTNVEKIIDGFIKIPLTEKEYERVFQLEILGTRDINALFWGRYVTALFGVGVVYLTYLLAKILFGVWVGRTSAFLVAINYRQVLNSHLGLPDIYNAFFLLLSLIVSWYLLQKPSRRNYFLAAIAAGISFSTKYQTFAFIPLLFAHLVNVFKERGWRKRLKFFFRPSVLMVPLVILLVFLVLDPYHFIKIEETLYWLNLISLKYRMGRMQLDFYPYSYLYHIGIGKIASIFMVFGVVACSIKEKFKSAYLLIIVIPVFYILTYYSGGGFYTRNFVTIIPVILIFAGWLIVEIAKIRPKITNVLIFMALFFIATESLSNSLIIVKNYRLGWNFEEIKKWNMKNIPLTAAVAAHPSVFLPDEVKRIPYNLDNEQFSLEEFKELGSDFIVINLDWATVGFYGWMAQTTKKSFEYWDKPVEELEQTFAAMAIREICDYAIYSVVKPWQAPESDFVVAKVPRYEITSKKIFKEYSFVSPVEIWNSDPIYVKGWGGYTLDAKTIGAGRGYLYVSFYKELKDVGNVLRRVSVKLSSREGLVKIMSGQIPKDSNYMMIGFEVYDSHKAKAYLEKINLYKTNVEVDFSGYNVQGIKLHDGVIFPNSHGNM